MAGTANHDAVWDDSDLLTSWDEAFAEYKKYHSLAAKGEEIPIDELPAEAKPEPEQVRPAPETYTAKTKRRKLELQAANGEASGGAATIEQVAGGEASAVPAVASGPGAMAVPQALLGAVQDEGLKNLMMSWYYAGYYTGLYEGKQQAQQG